MSLYRFALVFPLRVLLIFIRCLYYSFCKCRWYPLSKDWLKSLDKKTKALLKHKNSSKFVTVRVSGRDIKIWTVSVVSDRHRSTIPIVLVHGITGGSNLFLNNIDEFAKHRNVYLIDLPGWGFSGDASIRVKYEDGWWVDTTAADVELFYTQSLERWFQKMQLDKAIILGHGFGSYVCSIFSMFHPNRVAHLILSEPWGYQRRPAAADRRPFMANKPIKMFSELYAKVFIFTPIRVLGPLALPLYRHFRLGMKEKYMAFWKGLDPQKTSMERIRELMMEEREECFPDMTMQDYTYLWMMHSKNGEIAYDRLSIPFGWPRLPLEERVDQWVDDLDMTFIFGSKSWIRSGCGWQTKHHRHDSYVEVHEIGGAGHHVFADRPSAFNNIVNLIGEAVDKGIKPNISEDFKQRSKAMSRLRRQVSSSMMLQAAEGPFHRRSLRGNEVDAASLADVLTAPGEEESETVCNSGEDEEVVMGVEEGDEGEGDEGGGSDREEDVLLGAVGGVSEEELEYENETQERVLFSLE